MTLHRSGKRRKAERHRAPEFLMVCVLPADTPELALVHALVQYRSGLHFNSRGIAVYESADGERRVCHDTVSEIARSLGMSRPTVRKALCRLDQEIRIWREQGGWMVNVSDALSRHRSGRRCKVPGALLARTDLRAAAKLVYGRLLATGGVGKLGYVLDQADVAKDVNVSPGTVKRAIAALRAEGLLQPTRVGRYTRMTVSSVVTDALPRTGNGCATHGSAESGNGCATHHEPVHAPRTIGDGPNQQAMPTAGGGLSQPSALAAPASSQTQIPIGAEGRPPKDVRVMLAQLFKSKAEAEGRPSRTKLQLRFNDDKFLQRIRELNLELTLPHLHYQVLSAAGVHPDPFGKQRMSVARGLAAANVDPVLLALVIRHIARRPSVRNVGAVFATTYLPLLLSPNREHLLERRGVNLPKRLLYGAGEPRRR